MFVPLLVTRAPIESVGSNDRNVIDIKHRIKTIMLEFSHAKNKIDANRQNKY